VPLARLRKRVFTADEVIEAQIDVAHYGPEPLRGVTASVSLKSAEGKEFGHWETTADVVPLGLFSFGNARIPLGSVPAPGHFKLVVQLKGTRYENDWGVWVYPPRVETRPPAGVIVVEDLDERVLDSLESGARAVLMIPPARVSGDRLGKVAIGFSSIFWNTAWTRRQAPHTLGILCDPKNPALALFPTEYHSNWQWWYLISRSQAMILDGMPPALRPIVQVIDDWFTNRRLGLVFEAKLGRGSLMVSSIDLKKDLDANPVARQMFSSLLSYAGSDRFKPSVAVSAGQIRALYEIR